MKLLIAIMAASLLLVPAKKPELKIKAPRLVFLPPGGFPQRSSVTVRVTAHLDGDPENPEDFYCLTEVWEWGDDERSTHEPDCEPYQPGAELKRNFSATHRYREPDSYAIVFRLEKAKKTVIRSQSQILVRGDEEPPEGRQVSEDEGRRPSPASSESAPPFSRTLKMSGRWLPQPGAP